MKGGRLSQFERSATPRAAVLRWLGQAHAFATLLDYGTWLLSQSDSRWPLAFLPGQVDAAVRRKLRRAPKWEVTGAVQEAVAKVVFLFELAMLLNAVTDDRRREADLRCQLLFAELRALVLERGWPDEGDPLGIEADLPVAERYTAWREALATEVADLACTEAARGLLERRYLDGRLTLFPRTAEQWQDARDALDELTDLADDVLEETDAADAGSAGHDAAMARASQLADRARSATLGLLGDLAGARAVTARRMRTASRAPPQ